MILAKKSSLGKLKIKTRGFILVFAMLCTLVLCTGCGKSNDIAGLNLPESGGSVSSILGSEQAVKAISQQLVVQKDKYASYYSPEEFAKVIEGLNGVYSGIGVYIFEGEESGLVTISSVMKNTPAYKAGLMPGDEIVELNGKSLIDLSTEEVSNSLKGFPVGTRISLGVNRPGVGKKVFNLSTQNVEVPTLESTILTGDNNIGVIKIFSFTKSTGSQFVEELNELLDKDISALILDLRDNGGGEVNSALQVCDVFIEKGKPLMFITDPTGTFSYVAATDKLDLPVMALQNENSASASEIVLGAIQDSGAGETLGVTSYGKGLVQEIQPLQSGAAVKVTVSKYATAGEKDIHKIGIKPNYEFPMPEDIDIYASLTLDPKEDPQLAEAVRILNLPSKETNPANNGEQPAPKGSEQ